MAAQLGGRRDSCRRKAWLDWSARGSRRCVARLRCAAHADGWCRRGHAGRVGSQRLGAWSSDDAALFRWWRTSMVDDGTGRLRTNRRG
ncbi:hypothetical protein E5676_scaffold562G001180 [Cucumis melo var. makuwa]|uniref:Uncharacterized protein n=1 Tax=Cucumis melo var. makuwa TaxID=1194695 RepID=A0A5D3BKP3_CUCMM|nr:hypothetical protein E5676_scaffold562G001180 [Cucumis melo var. makuwa]